MPIVILGSDALLAASPATPVQLAHACLRAGFANVVPASWGDELIAAGVLRRLPDFSGGPAIQCSCPIVAHRLLTVGGDLRPALLPLVPPPVAVARYVKFLSHATPTRLTYVGACPGAVDESIDIRMTPEALIAMLAEREIHLLEQPRVFESIIPPDRRRHFSQPGGLPSAELLWNQPEARAIVELEGEDIASELAQQLLSGKNVLIDVSSRLGCVCSGAVPGASPKDARANIIALEPPRASLPVLENVESIALDQPVPAAPRTPVDVMAVPASSTPPKPMVSAAPMAATALGHRISPVRSAVAVPEPRPARISNPNNPRPVLGAVPVARDSEGKSLPRAYVARRRSSPRSFQAVVNPAGESPRQTGGAVLTPPRGAPIIEPAAAMVDTPLAELPPLVDAPAAPPKGPVIVTVTEPAKLEAAPIAKPVEPPRDLPEPTAYGVGPNGQASYVSREPASLGRSVDASQTRAAPALIFPGSRKQTLITLVATLVIALSVGVVVAVAVSRSLH